MSGFHEVSLPLPLALGASGGPGRRVDIVQLASGHEMRNTPWAHGRRRYDVGGAMQTIDDLHALLAFFEARHGQLYGFRFRDPLDCKSCAPSATPTPTDQLLGVGDGETATFHLTKSYGDAPHEYVRRIVKPVAGSVRVAISGVETDAFILDVTTGLLTLASAPVEGAAVSAGFLFDTPVRFEIERLDMSLDAFSAGRVVSAPLIEILP